MSLSNVHGENDYDQVRELLLQLHEPKPLSPVEDLIRTTMWASLKWVDQEGRRLEKLEEEVHSLVEQMRRVLQQLKQMAEAPLGEQEIQEEPMILKIENKAEEPPCDYLDEWTEYIYPKEVDK